MFVGLDMVASPLSGDCIVEPETNINKITLRNMWVKEIFGTNWLDGFEWNNNPLWNYGTIIHGIYKDNLNGGNIAYSADIVKAIRIKKRFKGEPVFKTIYEKTDITNPEDFTVNFIDYLEPSNKEVEYKYVPVFEIDGKNVDMESEGAVVYSQFSKWFLVGQYDELAETGAIANVVHPMELDMTPTRQLNRQYNTIATLGSKKPFTITNGMSKYYSGSMTVTFIELCNHERIDVEHGWKYRNIIDDWLTDGYAKIMKNFEGDIWMINVNDNISHTENGHYQNVNTVFNWVEAGDPTSVGDLYDNAFINTDVDRSLDNE